MSTVKLSARLAAIAGLVPEGARVLDVGTDHGYIPIWLLQTGKAVSVIASDIRPGPLSAAETSAERFGVTDGLRLIMTDGLSHLGNLDFDTVVIAGMGGETIIDILRAAPWLKNREPLLILQPQTKVSAISRWLEKNGYYLKNARLVEDDGRIYLIICVKVGDTPKTLTPAEYYAPPALLENRDPLLPAYLDWVTAVNERALSGLRLSGSAEKQAEARCLSGALDGLREMKKETEAW